MTIAKINGQEREVTTAYTAREGEYEATAPTMEEAVMMTQAMQHGKFADVVMNEWRQRERKRTAPAKDAAGDGWDLKAAVPREGDAVTPFGAIGHLAAVQNGCKPGTFEKASAPGTVEVMNATALGAEPAKTRGQEIATRLLCLRDEDFLVMKSPCGGVLYLGKGAWKHTEEVAREIVAKVIDQAIADDRAAMDEIIKVAVKKEREACAAIADRGAGKEIGGEFTEGWTRGCETIAALIRSQK